MKLIHYGSNRFIHSQFDEIRNREFSASAKPFGGLWSCPVDSNYGWKEFCTSGGCFEETLKESFVFELSDNAKVYVIDNEEDLKKIANLKVVTELNCSIDKRSYINFETLKLEYDAIHLTQNGEWKTRYSHRNIVDGVIYSLYGWEFESVLILNKECIKI